MATSISSTAIHDSRSYGPAPTTQGRGNAPNSWYASPGAVDRHPPPDLYFSQRQLLSGPQFPAYAPPDQRGDYYDDRCPPAPGYGQELYSSGFYPTHLASGGYKNPPGGSGVAPQLTQAAPGQRVSVACDSCRRRKIKCSDPNSNHGGRCTNCARLGQECIFKPAPSSTKFVSVSAIPSGVPLGTQLFGAYGQPLAERFEAPWIN